MIKQNLMSNLLLSLLLITIIFNTSSCYRRQAVPLEEQKKIVPSLGENVYKIDKEDFQKILVKLKKNENLLCDYTNNEIYINEEALSGLNTVLSNYSLTPILEPLIGPKNIQQLEIYCHTSDKGAIIKVNNKQFETTFDKVYYGLRRDFNIYNKADYKIIAYSIKSQTLVILEGANYTGGSSDNVCIYDLSKTSIISNDNLFVCSEGTLLVLNKFLNFNCYIANLDKSDGVFLGVENMDGCYLPIKPLLISK